MVNIKLASFSENSERPASEWVSRIDACCFSLEIKLAWLQKADLAKETIYIYMWRVKGEVHTTIQCLNRIRGAGCRAATHLQTVTCRWLWGRQRDASSTCELQQWHQTDEHGSHGCHDNHHRDDPLSKAAPGRWAAGQRSRNKPSSRPAPLGAARARRGGQVAPRLRSRGGGAARNGQPATATPAAYKKERAPRVSRTHLLVSRARPQRSSSS